MWASDGEILLTKLYHPPAMPKITVDGKSIDCKPGQMILQATNDAGYPIPQYCYHPGLSIVASCRMRSRIRKR
jgi:predicted molibdopterin-dependent oxidoreductase YjgC